LETEETKLVGIESDGSIPCRAVQRGQAILMNQWKVTAYTGKHRDKILGHSWVRASSEQQAIELGRRALRLIGVRGSFRVSASLYSPLSDWVFAGYVVRV
jgi:hypothetical protein